MGSPLPSPASIKTKKASPTWDILGIKERCVGMDVSVLRDAEQLTQPSIHAGPKGGSRGKEIASGWLTRGC